MSLVVYLFMVALTYATFGLGWAIAFAVLAVLL